MTINAVVFDIGRVLLEWDPEGWYDRKLGPERRKQLFAEVDLHAMNLRVDEGADFRATIYGTADRHPAWADDIRSWHDDWLQMAHSLIPRSVRLLRALRAKGVPVFALTNFGVGSFDVAQAEYDALNEFDREYVSGRLKLIKPDPRIYAVVEQDCGLAPDSLLFADDRPENIDAAAACGWQTHLFTTPDGWADRLVAEGLLSESEAA